MRVGSERAWTLQHDLALIEATRHRLRIADIATLSDRTEGAIRARLKRLRNKGMVGHISREGGRGRYPRARGQSKIHPRRQGSESAPGLEGVGA